MLVGNWRNDETMFSYVRRHMAIYIITATFDGAVIVFQMARDRKRRGE